MKERMARMGMVEKMEESAEGIEGGGVICWSTGVSGRVRARKACGASPEDSSTILQSRG